MDGDQEKISGNGIIGRAPGLNDRIQISSDEVEEKLHEKMKELDEKRKEEAIRSQAAQAGANYIFLKGFPISPEALIMIREEQASELKLVCFLKTDNEFRLGTVNPSNPKVMEILRDLERDTKSHGEVYQISELSLAAAMKLYATIPKLRKYEGGVEITASDLEHFKNEIRSFRDLGEKIQHVSMTDMLVLVLASAIKSDASDVHIEAEQDDIKIRFRIDGFLHDVAVIDKKLWQKIINRIKLTAKLKINIADIPQDGRFSIYLKEEFIDVRVSTVPTSYGESVVMRLLMSSATAFNLEDLGLTGLAYERLKKEIERPNGMILNTGPTGSGKTTTLYAVLKKLNKPESKVITLENPIEYRLKGVIQSQVETTDLAEEGKESAALTGTSGRKRHFTYAIALKSVLRQDPDVVMIGEIRDKETAEIAIQASLTGHLMLSTLHTNSAAGAIPRLLSMEAKPFLLAPSLNMVIGQRLVRKNCEYCKIEYKISDDIRERIIKVLDSLPPGELAKVDKNNIKLFKGQGCDKCNKIGYKGRLGIFEILTMNEDIQNLILEGHIAETQIKEAAKKNNFITMVQDGIMKALQGKTTPDEVFRVIE
ncbi:MAG: GspE/PulE family protein [Patescibacteria group bacterium]